MKHVNILLPDYVLGRLAQEERSLVERHLQSCPLCQEDEREVRLSLERIPPSTKAAPDGYFSTLLPRIRMRIDTGAKTPGMAWDLLNRLLIPLGVGVAALFFVVTLSVQQPGVVGHTSMPGADLATSEVFDALLWNLPITEPVDDLVSPTVLAEELIRGVDEADVYNAGGLFSSSAIELSEQDASALLERLNERNSL